MTRLISIIGPPAVGKTTLARLLSERLAARLICEDFEGNVFLADSYRGFGEACLPAQLQFLLSRVAQLSQSALRDDRVVVSDYGFCQDRIFAMEKLSADEYEVYRVVADRLGGLVIPPALVICLDAPVDVLVERIARRGRGYESCMTPEFLASMRDAYNGIESAFNFFGVSGVSGVAGCGVLRVDTAMSDFRDESVFDKLFNRAMDELATVDDGV